MDINELALTIQQSRSARQTVYAQYQQAQDDFFPLHYHGTLEETVLLAGADFVQYPVCSEEVFAYPMKDMLNDTMSDLCAN